MAVTNLHSESAQITNPFDTLNEVGCHNESILAALKIVSDSIHEFFDGHRGELTKGQCDALYQDWLLLEMVRREAERNDRAFHAAESTLYKAGVPHQFRNAA